MLKSGSLRLEPGSFFLIQCFSLWILAQKQTNTIVGIRIEDRDLEISRQSFRGPKVAISQHKGLCLIIEILYLLGHGLQEQMGLNMSPLLHWL